MVKILFIASVVVSCVLALASLLGLIDLGFWEAISPLLAFLGIYFALTILPVLVMIVLGIVFTLIVWLVCKMIR